jgi:hypothetical protein
MFFDPTKDVTKLLARFLVRCRCEACTSPSRRDTPIVAWHKVPGKASSTGRIFWGGTSPRHFVPGYGRIVPPGHFKQASAVYTLDWPRAELANQIGDNRHEPIDHGPMPHAIFTSPESAGVGATEEELKQSRKPYFAACVPFISTTKGRDVKEEYGLWKLLIARPQNPGPLNRRLPALPCSCTP